MTLGTALDMVLDEYERSLSIHGDWRGYDVDRMMRAITHELMVEVGEAEKRGDIHGEHGMVRELAQVANCCIKAMMVLSQREVL